MPDPTPGAGPRELTPERRLVQLGRLLAELERLPGYVDDAEALRSAIAALSSASAPAVTREQLRSIEWAADGSSPYANQPLCPVCRAPQRYKAHHKDCWLDRALGGPNG